MNKKDQIKEILESLEKLKIIKKENFINIEKIIENNLSHDEILELKINDYRDALIFCIKLYNNIILNN